MGCERRFYVCKVCGNLVGLIHSGGGTLSCCGQPMTLLVPNTVEASKEKHIPVVTIDGGKVTVAVGSVPHPMIAEHYIEWIYICSNSGGQRKALKPGDKPEATFLVEDNDICEAFAYCNIHGLWSVTIAGAKCDK